MILTFLDSFVKKGNVVRGLSDKSCKGWQMQYQASILCGAPTPRQPHIARRESRVGKFIGNIFGRATSPKPPRILRHHIGEPLPGRRYRYRVTLVKKRLTASRFQDAATISPVYVSSLMWFIIPTLRIQALYFSAPAIPSCSDSHSATAMVVVLSARISR